MTTIQLQVTLTDEANAALTEIVEKAVRKALHDPEEEKRQARLKSSQNAIYAGQKPPTDQGLLINSRQAGKLLGISERTLWTWHNTGRMPQPIRIGSAVRWSITILTKWVEAGCPKPDENE